MPTRAPVPRTPVTKHLVMPPWHIVEALAKKKVLTRAQVLEIEQWHGIAVTEAEQLGQIVEALSTFVTSQQTEAADPTVETNALLDGRIHSDTVAAVLSRGAMITVDSSGLWNVISLGAVGTVVRSDGSDPAFAYVDRLQESSGPTVLVLGTVADGEFLKRSGATLVSGVPTGASNALLDGAQHSDTTAASPSAGAVIQGTSTKWEKIPPASDHQVVQSGGWTATPSVTTLKTSDIDEDPSTPATGVNIDGAVAKDSFLGSGGVTDPSQCLDGEGDGVSPLVRLTGYGAGIPGLQGRRAKGSKASQTAVIIGDDLVLIGGRGHDGTSIPASDQATVRLQANETWGASARGTRQIFSTTPNGSTTIAERARIDHDGQIGINETAPAAQLHVIGSSASDPVILANAPSGAPHLRLVTASTVASPTSGDLWNAASNVLNYRDGSTTRNLLARSVCFSYQENTVADSQSANVGTSFATHKNWILPGTTHLNFVPTSLVWVILCAATSATFELRIQNVTTGVTVAGPITGIASGTIRYVDTTFGTWPTASTDDIEIQVKASAVLPNTFNLSSLHLVAQFP